MESVLHMSDQGADHKLFNDSLFHSIVKALLLRGGLFNRDAIFIVKKEIYPSDPVRDLHVDKPVALQTPHGSHTHSSRLVLYPLAVFWVRRRKLS